MLIDNSPEISTIKRAQSTPVEDCLLHYDASKNTFEFIAGTDCDHPTPVEEIGAGVTLAAFLEMIIRYGDKMGPERSIFVDYGRKIFDSILYKADGSPSDVKAIRLYFGIRPNSNGDDQLTLVMVPLDSYLAECSQIRMLGDADKAGDDVGHGINTEQYNANENDVQNRTIIPEILKERGKWK